MSSSGRVWPLEGSGGLVLRTCCLLCMSAAAVVVVVVVPSFLLACQADYDRQVNPVTHCAAPPQAPVRWNVTGTLK